MKTNFIILLILLALSCKSPDTGLYEFDPRSFEENKFTLSEIGDGVAYIPLSDNIQLGPMYNIKFINNTIYFSSSKDIGILAFDREINTLRKIGIVGRGPGEYLYNNNYAVDEKTETVYILDRGDIIKVYSRTGQFIRGFPLQEYGSIEAIEFYNSKLFVSYAIQFENAGYKWIVVDTLGNEIKKKEREIPMFTANQGQREATYKLGNRIFYWNNYADTVFSILPDLSEEPSFIISPGEHRIPKSNLSLEQVQHWNYMEINTIFETTRFHVIRYFYNKPAILIFDKRNEDSFLIYLEYDGKTGELLSGIVNDLDGGLWFIPECYFSEMGREYMVGIINPYQIKILVSSSEFINSTPRYPEKKKEFEKLANSLKETDNPVFMIVRLKK